MKEAQIFENWINNLSEGTWALPETPEQMEKLNQLMSAELIVGPDATNATELLYDIVGDDELFDILNDLADKSEGRANIWDDSDVQRRLAELGVQTPQSTQAEPADVAQDTAPAAPAPAAPPVAEGELDEQVMGGQMNMFQTFSNNVANGQDAKQAALAVAKDYGMKPEQVMFDLASFGKQSPQWINTPELQNAVKTLQQLAAANQQLAAANRAFDPQIEESNELAEMLKYAGVPVKESVLTDSTGSTLEHIKDTYKRDVKDFTQSGEMSKHLYHALHDYYFDDMPYGAKTGDDIDPHEWVADRFAQDIGLDEGWKGALAGGLAGAGLGSVVPGLGTLAGGIAGAYAGHKIGDQGISDPTPDPVVPGAAAPQRNAPIKITAATRKPYDSGRMKPFQKTVAEGSCNMTMEGEYCPEHGLMECGSMYEDGGAVGMPYSMGEGTDDPINSNSAMTGSYYEGKETKSQEGDALLARIKSLALLR